MIEARLPASSGGPPPSMVAMGAAAGQLAVLRMWLVGEASCSADILTEQLVSMSACGEIISLGKDAA